MLRVVRPESLKLCVKLGSQVCCAAFERCELRVVRLWHFDAVLLAELHHDIEEVHRIEVQLLAEFDLRLDVGGVFIGRDFCDDIDDESGTGNEFDLVVRATDGVTPDDETITITITDTAPTVTDADSNFAESTSCAGTVVDLATTGDQTGLTWSIVSGNEDTDGDNTDGGVDSDFNLTTNNFYMTNALTSSESICEQFGVTAGSNVDFNTIKFVETSAFHWLVLVDL